MDTTSCTGGGYSTEDEMSYKDSCSSYIDKKYRFGLLAFRLYRRKI